MVKGKIGKTSKSLKILWNWLWQPGEQSMGWYRVACTKFRESCVGFAPKKLLKARVTSIQNIYLPTVKYYRNCLASVLIKKAKG